MRSSDLLKTLLCLTVFTSTAGAWQIDIGIRLVWHDIFGTLFLLLFAFWVLSNKSYKIKAGSTVKNFIMVSGIVLFTKYLSIVGLAEYYSKPEAFHQSALSQFALGTIKQTLYFLLFAAVGVYIYRSDVHVRSKLVNVYLASVVASCLYQYVSLVVILWLNIDLDKAIWSHISYGYDPNSSTIASQIIGASGFKFYRAGGLSVNPNAFAIQIASVLPFVIYKTFFAKRPNNKKYILLTLLFSISFTITLSRSGMLSLLVSSVFLTIFFIRRLKFLFSFKFYIISGLFIAILFFQFGKVIPIFAERFITNDKTNSVVGIRSQLNEAGIEVFSEFPVFGVGNNVSSVMLDHYPEVVKKTGANFHNYWLINLIESGIIGLFFVVVFYGYLLFRSVLSTNEIGKVFFASLIGLIVAGFFNSSLFNFPTQIFICLFFFSVCSNTTVNNSDLIPQDKSRNFQY